MKVDFVRTGGFAGLVLRISLNTEQLEMDEAARLEGLVDAAGFFDLPARPASHLPGADRFQYRVAVSARKHSHAVTCADGSIPDRLRPLLDYLTSAAMQRTDSNKR